VDGLLATKSEGVGLIVCAISFHDFQNDFQCDPDPPTSQTDGRTDGRTTCNRNTVLCTTCIVHRAVKTYGDLVDMKACVKKSLSCNILDMMIRHFP